MKLRIRGNSIRLRLLQSEVKTLQNEGRVSESIKFGAGDGDRLVYAVQVIESAPSIGAIYAGNTVTVNLPEEIARQWTESETVGISAKITVGKDSLDILVEKDFVCLTRTDDPDNLDAFPNPESDNC